ncbi:transcriptional regulator, GntR family [Quadrisphaera granulorum]|uniref:GntR family transcriptional regulator n=1 Tax=Quadrisphaera granulorum TaxID=317664 RepID=A0A316A764_9ACTN|nr:FCD domain-containing protein [Quadrisphaera granulorum]PWJ53058.1 GntR family transcriptional regulator [Quadrisphaera granulorum]SZE97223.1 transcriptional regulator, GntR family [Quadrisphaera granulorum]
MPSAHPGETHPAVPALTAPAVAGLTRLSAVDTVRGRIGLAIDLGLLSVGEALPPDSEVAEALGVSEITVRRALRSLADDGILRRVRGRSGGTFVADTEGASELPAVRAFRGDSAEVHRLIDVRTLLETSLTHFAAREADARDIEALEEAVSDARAATDWTGYHAADERFHLGVAQAAHRPHLVGPYRDALHRLYAYFVPYPIEYLHGVNREHADLVDALRTHDAVAAVAIAERHVAALHTTMFVGLTR